jgi:hypothetical protein
MGRTEVTRSGVQWRGGLADEITDQDYCVLSYDTDTYQRFGEFYCLYLRDRRLAAGGFFEAIVPTYQPIWRQEANFFLLLFNYLSCLMFSYFE